MKRVIVTGFSESATDALRGFYLSRCAPFPTSADLHPHSDDGDFNFEGSLFFDSERPKSDVPWCATAFIFHNENPNP